MYFFQQILASLFISLFKNFGVFKDVLFFEHLFTYSFFLIISHIFPGSIKLKECSSFIECFGSKKTSHKFHEYKPPCGGLRKRSRKKVEYKVPKKSSNLKIKDKEFSNLKNQGISISKKCRPITAVLLLLALPTFSNPWSNIADLAHRLLRTRNVNICWKPTISNKLRLQLPWDN